jgi:WD40 repeat protein
MFHYKVYKIWLGWLGIIFFITACGPVTAVPEVKPTLVITPPPVTLEVDGVTQMAGIGSYCWSSGGVISKSLCADMAGIPTASDPLVLTEFPVNAKFHFEMELAPDDVTISVMPARSGQELLGADSAHRLWNPSEGWSGSLPPKVNFEYPFQETEFVSGDGLYIILISANWKDFGDASYSFLIQIGAGNQQVSATPGESIPTPELVSLQMMTPVTRLGKGAASSLALSADGKWLAVNTPLGVYVYETETQNEIWFLPLGNAQWRVLDFSPNGDRLAIGSQNGGVLVVRSDTGKTLYHIATEESGQPDWSPDGTKLLTGAGCEEVRVWDGNSGELIQTVQEVKCNNVVPGIVRAVWSRDGQHIYVNENYGNVLAYDAKNYQPMAGYEPHPPEYSFGLDIIPSPTEDLLALENGLSIAILNSRTGEIVKMLASTQTAIPVRNISWSPDGKSIAAIDDGLAVWDVTTGRQILNISGYQSFPGLSWMPDGKTLVGLLSTDGSLNAVNLDGETVFSLYGFGMMNGYSASLFWDGSQLLTYDGAHITHWEALIGKILKQEQASSQPTWASAGLSPDGTRIASPDAVMDSKNFKEIARLIDNPEHGRDQVAWSPGGTTLASGDSLNISPIILWDAQTGKQMLTLPTGDIPLYLGGLAFSPDGNLLAAGGSLMNPANGLDNGVLILWNVSSGERVNVLTAGMSGQRIMSIAWSPDGRWLAAGTYSGRIVLWDMLTLQPVASLDGHADQVLGLGWSDDSRLLASNSLDGTVLIWKLP